MKMIRCQACSKKLEINLPVGRREVCVFCGNDLHSCLNCAFYFIGAYNDCREPQAERVMEKGRSNFCDYFIFREGIASAEETNNRDTAKGRLEGLFKKD